MTPLLDRLGLYRTRIIQWFIATALSLYFSGAALTPEEETAITTELDAQLLVEQTP